MVFLGSSQFLQVKKKAVVILMIEFEELFNVKKQYFNTIRIGDII